MGNIFHKDFQEFIISLNENQVEYILIGGYAVILHGYFRTTGDLDIWINPIEKNYEKLKLAFYSFGLPSDAFTKSEFLDSSEMDVFTFGRPPVSIDIMTKVKGLNFRDAFAESVIDISQGFEIRLVHYSDLIKAKKATGRFRDLSDIAHLEEE